MAKSLLDYCLEREEFELLAQWDKEKNGGLSPRDVSHGSHKKIWWKCAFGHSWQAVVYTRTGQHSGCPYCTGRMLPPSARVLADECPELAKEWHPDLNGDLTPQMVTAGSHKKVWWQCAEGHIWRAVIYSRTGDKKCGCPVCSGKVKESKQIRYADIMAERLKNK